MSAGRDLIVVRAGRNAHFPFATGKPAPAGITVVTSAYQPLSPAQDAYAPVFLHAGGKFEGLFQLFQEQPELLKSHDYVWLPDDDLDVDWTTVLRIFAHMRTHSLLVAQPALSIDSFFSHPVVLEQPAFRLRYSTFVEVMAPCFSTAYFRTLLPWFEKARFGWGLDFLWTRAMANPSHRSAILDDCVVRHLRPVGSGSLYQSDRSPWTELAERQLKRPPGFWMPTSIYGALSSTGRWIPPGPRLVLPVAAQTLKWLRLRPGDDLPSLGWRMLKPHLTPPDLSPLPPPSPASGPGVAS